MVGAVYVVWSTVTSSMVLLSLIVATIWLGVYPQPILDVTAASVEQLIANYEAALSGSASTALAQ